MTTHETGMRTRTGTRVIVSPTTIWRSASVRAWEAVRCSLAEVRGTHRRGTAADQTRTDVQPDLPRW